MSDRFRKILYPGQGMDGGKRVGRSPMSIRGRLQIGDFTTACHILGTPWDQSGVIYSLYNRVVLHGAGEGNGDSIAIVWIADFSQCSGKPHVNLVRG
jgi:hypothetical protein